jgi:hypothetical protein
VSDDDPRTTTPLASARRTARIGAIVLLCSMAVMFLPALVSLGSGAKYLVAIAFVGTIAGLSIAVNGLIDAWRSRGSRRSR